MAKIIRIESTRECPHRDNSYCLLREPTEEPNCFCGDFPTECPLEDAPEPHQAQISQEERDALFEELDNADS